MKIRTKLFLIFFFLAILPMLIISIVFHFRSVNSIKNILKNQTSILAENVAEEIENRYSLVTSDMILLSENQHTQDFYRSYINHDIENSENVHRLRDFLERFYNYRYKYFVYGIFYNKNFGEMITFGEDISTPFHEKIFNFQIVKNRKPQNDTDVSLPINTTLKNLKKNQLF